MTALDRCRLSEEALVYSVMVGGQFPNDAGLANNALMILVQSGVIVVTVFDDPTATSNNGTIPAISRTRRLSQSGRHMHRCSSSVARYHSGCMAIERRLT